MKAIIIYDKDNKTYARFDYSDQPSIESEDAAEKGTLFFEEEFEEDGLNLVLDIAKVAWKDCGELELKTVDVTVEVSFEL